MPKNNIPDRMTVKEFQEFQNKGLLDFSGTKGKVNAALPASHESNIGKKEFMIGIDPGVKTGIAIFNPKTKEFYQIKTVNIIEAQNIILAIKGLVISVTVEDARMVRYFKAKDKKNAESKAQGAGSIKNECRIWELFLIYHSIPYRFVRPNPKITKLSADTFKKMTGYQKQTSEHARDAALLVYNN